MKDWIYGIVENLLYNNLVEDEELEHIEDEELDRRIQKVCDCLIDDGDLETEIVRLIEENAEWYYYHEAKNKYVTEVNIDDSYKEMEVADEWGVAYVWAGKFGAEYNYCTDGENNYSAIYMMEMANDGQWYTITDNYKHYEINWDSETWKRELEIEMVNFVKENTLSLGEH